MTFYIFVRSYHFYIYYYLQADSELKMFLESQELNKNLFQQNTIDHSICLSTTQHLKLVELKINVRFL